MRGEISTGRLAKRHPLDWYVEEGWEWDQIVAAIGLELPGVTIWDPAAGFGHSASRLQAWHPVNRFVLSDVVDNVAWGDFEDASRVAFYSADFLEMERVPRPNGTCSIWSNPPFSYKKVWYDGRQVSISEAFVRHALSLATDRVVMLLPAKWLAMGIKRSRLVRTDHPPATVLHFCQRPSMPPGDRIHLMGNRAYRGGMVDYCAVVWDVRHPTAPGETRTVWLPPLAGDA
jgi:hypothetical protein